MVHTRIVCIDDRKFGPLKLVMLDFDAEQNQMRQISKMDWRSAAFAQEARVIMLGRLVIYPKLDIVRQQVFNFYGRSESQR